MNCHAFQGTGTQLEWFGVRLEAACLKIQMARRPQSAEPSRDGSEYSYVDLLY